MESKVKQRQVPMSSEIDLTRLLIFAFLPWIIVRINMSPVRHVVTCRHSRHMKWKSSSRARLMLARSITVLYDCRISCVIVISDKVLCAVSRRRLGQVRFLLWCFQVIYPIPGIYMNLQHVLQVTNCNTRSEMKKWKWSHSTRTFLPFLLAAGIDHDWSIL